MNEYVWKLRIVIYYMYYGIRLEINKDSLFMNKVNF